MKKAKVINGFIVEFEGDFSCFYFLFLSLIFPLLVAVVVTGSEVGSNS